MIPEPRRSVLTLALGGVGLVLFLVLLTTALVVMIKKPPRVAETPAPAASTPAPPVRSPSPVVLRSGVVRVESTPPGATVSIDGRAVGTTPMDVHDVSLASHEVKLELKGFAPVTESVMLTPELPRTVVVKALTRTEPATGLVDVSSTPAGAMVKIDGTSVGLTPLRAHKITVGSHRIEVTAEGHEPFAERVRITEGATTRLSPSLTVKAKPAPPRPAPQVAAPPPAPTPDPTVYDENSPLLSAKPVKTLGKSAEYPRDAVALKRGQRASVTVSFVVLESGDVTDVQIVESAGATVDDAVVAAYKTWKFTPGTKQGGRVKVRVTRRQTFLGG